MIIYCTWPLCPRIMADGLCSFVYGLTRATINSSYALRNYTFFFLPYSSRRTAAKFHCKDCNIVNVSRNL